MTIELTGGKLHKNW